MIDLSVYLPTLPNCIFYIRPISILRGLALAKSNLKTVSPKFI